MRNYNISLIDNGHHIDFVATFENRYTIVTLTGYYSVKNKYLNWDIVSTSDERYYTSTHSWQQIMDITLALTYITRDCKEFIKQQKNKENN